MIAFVSERELDLRISGFYSGLNFYHLTVWNRLSMKGCAWKKINVSWTCVTFRPSRKHISTKCCGIGLKMCLDRLNAFFSFHTHCSWQCSYQDIVRAVKKTTPPHTHTHTHTHAHTRNVLFTQRFKCPMSLNLWRRFQNMNRSVKLKGITKLSTFYRTCILTSRHLVFTDVSPFPNTRAHIIIPLSCKLPIHIHLSTVFSLSHVIWLVWRPVCVTRKFSTYCNKLSVVSP